MKLDNVKPAIMAVDDKPEILTTVLDMLKDDYNVMALTNGKAALKALTRRTPNLFLLDIEMPQMSGYALAAEIRKIDKFKGTPIIFLTANNSREAVLQAIGNGGNDYVLKPVDKTMLLSKVRQQLNP